MTVSSEIFTRKQKTVSWKEKLLKGLALLDKDLTSCFFTSRCHPHVKEKKAKDLLKETKHQACLLEGLYLLYSYPLAAALNFFLNKTNHLLPICINQAKIPLALRHSGGLVTKSCLSLATPWTVACQATLSMGFSRQEYWRGLPFPSPGDLPDLGIKPGSPAL